MSEPKPMIKKAKCLECGEMVPVAELHRGTCETCLGPTYE